MVRAWPDVLVPAVESWTPSGLSASGGRAAGGFQQVVETPGGYWRASLTIPCRRPEQILALRGVAALGRAESWSIAPIEISRAPLEGAALAEAAPLNATVLKLALHGGGLPKFGNFLSLNGRLHTVVSVGPPGGVNGYVREIGIRPWLIRPGVRDQAVTFRRPACIMRLEAEDSATLALRLSRFGDVTLQLEEVVSA